MSLVCAMALIGAFSVGTTTASAASFSLPKLPALTLPTNIKLPSNTSGLISSLSGCASQKSLSGIASCALGAVTGGKVSIPSNLTSLIPSNISSLLKGVNLGNLSSILGGLLKK